MLHHDLFAALRCHGHDMLHIEGEDLNHGLFAPLRSHELRSGETINSQNTQRSSLGSAGRGEWRLEFNALFEGHIQVSSRSHPGLHPGLIQVLQIVVKTDL